ncbi:hypothetical protein Ciccas_009940, partial [Cichlidogyrus casuarinus]
KAASEVKVAKQQQQQEDASAGEQSSTFGGFKPLSLLPFIPPPLGLLNPMQNMKVDLPPPAQPHFSLPHRASAASTPTAPAVATPTSTKSPNQMRVLCDICNKWICNKYFLRTHKANKHGIHDGQPANATNSSNKKQALKEVSKIHYDEDKLMGPLNLSLRPGGHAIPPFMLPSTEDEMQHTQSTSSPDLQPTERRTFGRTALRNKKSNLKRKYLMLTNSFKRRQLALLAWPAKNSLKRARNCLLMQKLSRADRKRMQQRRHRSRQVRLQLARKYHEVRKTRKRRRQEKQQKQLTQTVKLPCPMCWAQSSPGKGQLYNPEELVDHFCTEHGVSRPGN